MLWERIHINGNPKDLNFQQKKKKQIKTEVYQHLYHSTFDQVWTNFNSPSMKMDTESQIHSDTYCACTVFTRI